MQHISDHVERVLLPKSNTIEQNHNDSKHKNQRKYDTHRRKSFELSNVCPRSTDICIGNGHFITNNKKSTFNFTTNGLFGDDLHMIKPEDVGYIKQMFCDYKSIDKFDINNECKSINESLILMHIHFPQMLYETWTRLTSKLFEYYILSNNTFMPKHKEYIFGYMQLDSMHLYPFHDLLLSPFTNYPIIHVQELLNYNIENVLLPKYDNIHNISNNNNWITDNIDDKLIFQKLKYRQHMNHYSKSHSDSANYSIQNNNNKCSCFEEIYWCGFYKHGMDDLFPLESWKDAPYVWKDVRLPNTPQSWDMSRYYKWYYYNKFGAAPSFMMNQKTKLRACLIDRHEPNPHRSNRKWTNIKDIIKQCNEWGIIECKIIYFEDMNHMDTIWEMQLADILIGFHGSGIVNGLFLPETSTIIEIQPSEGPMYKYHVMEWIFNFTPHRHIMHKLQKYQNHQFAANTVYNSPFLFEWNKLKPILEYVINNKYSYCDELLPKYLRNLNYSQTNKTFSKQSMLYDNRPLCSLK